MKENVYETGYKAYNPGLVCNGKQYAEGQVYEESGGKICGPGLMHYCVNPFDVLNYYPLVNAEGRFSDFTTVEALAEPVRQDDKSATKKIRIGAKLGFDGFVKACVDFLYEKTIKDMPKDKAESGDSAQIGSSGDDAQIGSSGRYAQIGSSGDDAVVVCEADNAVVGCVGKCAKIKAPLGTWITLAEYGEWDGEGFPCVCVRSAKIDGEMLNPGVFYTLKNGEFEEVDDETV